MALRSACGEDACHVYLVALSSDRREEVTVPVGDIQRYIILIWNMVMLAAILAWHLLLSN